MSGDHSGKGANDPRSDTDADGEREPRLLGRSAEKGYDL